MIDYTIDGAGGLIRVSTSGASTFTDLIRYLANLNDDPEFDAHFNTIFHVAEDATLPGAFFKDLLKTILEQWEQRRTGNKWAVVLPSKSQLRVAQLAAQSVDLKSVGLKFFGGEEDAMAWLSATMNLQMKTCDASKCKSISANVDPPESPGDSRDAESTKTNQQARM